MVDWSVADWAYLLGVVHGDGHVAKRSIEIAVGYPNADYATLLADVWHQMGYETHTYRQRSALRLDINNATLTEEFRQYKSDGLWCLPAGLNLPSWLAGVFDTDGCVSLASKKCAVVITLKRSGNLRHVANALSVLGVAEAKVHDGVSRYKGKDYLIENLRLTSFSTILAFAEIVRPRNKRKAERLREMVDYIREAMSVVPLWKEAAIWLQEESRTREEIAERFSLNKRQVDSLLQNIRRHADLEVIPPPKALSRYRVTGQFS